MRRSRGLLSLAVGASILVAACSGGGGSSAAPSAAPSADGSAAALTPVRLQLQWAPQAQFAGYFAADAQGYYEAEGLDVDILDGGPEVIPQQVGSAANGPEFTISWVPKVLESRNGTPASDLVNIAQIFQRSGTLSVSWKDTGITSPDDFAGKKVGVWDFGNEFEVTAAGLKAGLTAGTDYEKVIQPFDMTLLLSKQIDVAEAMIYNEYAQVLEATNPETGELYQPGDLNVINYNDEGTAMLQDALFARASWLAEAGNEDIATAFLKASFQGWIYCRDNPADCIQYTVDAGSQLAGRPPGLDDERDQPAHLAVAERHRDDGSRVVAADGRRVPGRPDHPRGAAGGGLSHGPGRGSARRVGGCRHHGRVLRQGHRGGHPGRGVAAPVPSQIRTAGASRAPAVLRAVPGSWDAANGHVARPSARYHRRVTNPDTLHVSSHPAVLHKLGVLRDEDTEPKKFREVVRELSWLLGYEALQDARTSPRRITTPMEEMDAAELGERIGLIPILRAGLGMVDAMLELMPTAEVWHLGLFRDERTLRPVEYYNKLPDSASVDLCLILDPMLATGGSATAAIDVLKRWGAVQPVRIKLINLIAAPEGVAAVQAAHPDVHIHCAALDRGLNEKGYIMPGLGDAGDRQFGTGH